MSLHFFLNNGGIACVQPKQLSLAIYYDVLILQTITSFHHHFLFQKLELVKSKDENESLQKSLKGMLKS